MSVVISCSISDILSIIFVSFVIDLLILLIFPKNLSFYFSDFFCCFLFSISFISVLVFNILFLLNTFSLALIFLII